MRQHKLNFFIDESVRDQEECQNEISIVRLEIEGNSDCWKAHEKTDNVENVSNTDNKYPLHIQYPLMKGAIYLKDVAKTVISDNTQFLHNDAGPILDNL